jgi:hypothetical protein
MRAELADQALRAPIANTHSRERFLSAAVDSPTFAARFV